MKVLLSWLRELVPVEVSPEELGARLTMRGLALEGLTETGEGVSGVVVAEVREVREHPNADSLMLVKADDGGEIRDIVCGARNYVVGDRVPLARPGARLPGGMEIGQRKVRGELSDGMLCSARELAIAEDHSGILLLDGDAPLGADVVSHLALRDVLFDFDVTPNRPDLLSVVGVAREIAALYGLPLTLPTIDLVEQGAPIETLASVEITDTRGCPRYVARVIEDVTIERSPWWMRQRLLASGTRPISNVVDITNYVLLEMGQPLHAFDLDRVDEARIVVRKARKNETITTLDDRDRLLAPTDVVIADGTKAVAVAGIMGGATSEVSDGTRRVLLESAYFDPMRIRPTAARLGLRTEASVRFERGADPEAAPVAAARAAGLLAAIAGGRVAPGAIDAYLRPIAAKPIRLSVARAGALIGAPQQTAQVQGWLRALGCETAGTGSTLRVTPPSWRPDLRIEEDLVEEVARSYGYDMIPETLPAGSRIGSLDARQLARRSVHRVLLGAGLTEAVTLSLMPPSLPDRIGVEDTHPLRRAFALANPLSEEESRLRVTLFTGLLLAAERNAARRVLPVRLFEQGIVFVPTEDGAPPLEREEMAWILAGPADDAWHGTDRSYDFYDAKGVAEAVLAGLGVDDVGTRPFDDGAITGALHPARCAVITARGADIGLIGELHPRVAAEFGLPARTAVGALRFEDTLAQATPSRGSDPARVPAVERDLALVVPDPTPHAVVRSTIERAAGPLLEGVRLFDVYDGAPIPEGHLSLAYRLILRAPDRTLTDADADGLIAAVTRAAVAAGWTVRA